MPNLVTPLGVKSNRGQFDIRPLMQKSKVLLAKVSAEDGNFPYKINYKKLFLYLFHLSFTLICVFRDFVVSVGNNQHPMLKFYLQQYLVSDSSYFQNHFNFSHGMIFLSLLGTNAAFNVNLLWPQRLRFLRIMFPEYRAQMNRRFVLPMNRSFCLNQRIIRLSAGHFMLTASVVFTKMSYISFCRLPLYQYLFISLPFTFIAFYGYLQGVYLYYFIQVTYSNVCAYLRLRLEYLQVRFRAMARSGTPAWSLYLNLLRTARKSRCSTNLELETEDESLKSQTPWRRLFRTQTDRYDSSIVVKHLRCEINATLRDHREADLIFAVSTGPFYFTCYFCLIFLSYLTITTDLASFERTLYICCALNIWIYICIPICVNNSLVIGQVRALVRIGIVLAKTNFPFLLFKLLCSKMHLN